MNNSKQLTIGALMILFFACKNSTNSVLKDAVVSNIDTTANPADDFFQFANGGWLKANPIPASESSWGVGKVLQEDIYIKMKKVSEDAAKSNASKGSNEQKIGDYWAMGMDTLKLEKEGLEPLKTELTIIENIKNKEGLLDAVALFQTYLLSPMFSINIYQDLKQSDKYAFYLWQGGLGMPERDYYFKTDERNANIRKEYQKHLINEFKLMGENEANAALKSQKVFEIEKFLAQSHRTIEALRDQYKNYNPMTINALQKMTPSVSWQKMLDKMDVKGVDTIIVGQPEYLKTIEIALNKFPIEDWKSYLKWQLVGSFSDKLSKAFEEESFNFFGKVLEGSKEQKPRWKRVLDAQENALGDALGQLFVKEFFPEKAKKRYENMVESVKNAYAENIKTLDWMSAETKAKALDKLQKVSKKVGYPTVWKDFSTMQIDRSGYARNAINSKIWWFNYMASKYGKSVDRNEWGMTPQTYNAYYNPSNNEIVLPAAIFMVPGFADDEIDDAVVYGYGAASTIGHEITHGFDDQGRQYDAIGNLVAWWSPQDSVKFMERAKMLVNQFNEYVAVDTMHVRGEATLGENIADLGGVVLGLNAFKQTEQYKKGEKISGYTPLQRYFMGYSLGWMDQQTKERAAKQIMTDVHSPAKLRVNGIFVNIPEFYEAFNVKPNNKMWREPAKRVKIW
jgi:putative endopeptidase